MGLFSFLTGKRKKSNTPTLSADLAKDQNSTPPISIPTWHHTLERVTIVTHPLGETPGTELDRNFLFSALFSLAHAISTEAHEEQHLESPFFALGSSIQAKAASEEFTCELLDVVGLTFGENLGYSARLSAHAKKYTVLLGEPSAVARASTPFHSEISAYASTPTDPSRDASRDNATDGERRFVLAIDGIAYAALTLASESRL